MRKISIGENYKRNITPIRSSIWRFSRGTVVRKMSIGWNYVGKLTPMRSNISRFSRGTDALRLLLKASIATDERDTLKRKFGPP